MFKGIVIEESLSDRSVLDSVKIIHTEIEQVTEGFKTPWLKQWTLYTVEIPEDHASIVAEELSHAIETEHTSWFADFNDDSTHYIIFPGKVFVIDRSNPNNYDEAKQYGVSLGIPEQQLSFPPQVE